MNRKKKKKASKKSAIDVELDRKKIKDEFIYRAKEVIKLVIHDEILKKIPAVFFENLFNDRYGKLKIVAAPGSNISKTKIAHFNKLLQNFIDETAMSLPNGNRIPIALSLTEGLVLADRLSTLETFGHPVLKELKSAFEYFSRENDFHYDLQVILFDLVTITCSLLNDFNDLIYRADLSMTAYCEHSETKNDIIIRAFKPTIETVETKYGMRNAIRLGWPNEHFEWEYFNVKPSKLGFQTGSFDIPLELYISTHTLSRLQERINITPGLMHEILLLTFLEPEIRYRWMGNESHVVFLVSGFEVGYLVVKMHGSKLLVHTFLFLTNNGTVEGKKLEQMLSISLSDKKYLGIDTLPAFNAYHIDKNEKLSKLFIDAGCGSLLKMGHVQEFTTNKLSDKDPESISKYLAGASYFLK